MTYGSAQPGQQHKLDHARRVRDLLRTRLLEREFGDSRLPDESRLMAEYGVGRNVIRAALALLQQEGLICRTQGAGTFSLTRKTRMTLRDASGFASTIGMLGVEVVSRVIATAEIPAPAGVAGRLEVATGSPCLVVDVTTSLDGQPAVVLTSYLADPAAMGRLRPKLPGSRWTGDWYDLLASVHLGPLRRETASEAVGADELVAPLLGLERGAPVMRFERTLRLGDDGVRECGYSYCRGDLFVVATSDGVLVGEAH